jgi:glycine/D-amino acid oxidase-like deaminating enzyme
VTGGGRAAGGDPLAAPASIWTATAGPAPDCPPLAGERRADVAVVGGGFTGLSAALHLAERGAEVVLLEAVEPGFGASGRNGGQVIPGLKIDPDEMMQRFGPERGARLAELAGGAADLVFDLVKRHGIECDARQGGWIKAAHAPGALRHVEATARQWARLGAPVELLDRRAVAEHLGTGAYVGGLLDRRGGGLNPLGYARGLARAAQRAGAAVHGQSPVLGARREGAGWRVGTPGGVVVAGQVIIGTNAYSDLAGPRAGPWPDLQRTIVPVWSYQAATRPLPDTVRGTILPAGPVVSDTRRLLLYFRLEPSGRLVMGGRGRFHDATDPALYRGVMAAARRLYPQLGVPAWEFWWSGKVALTLDHVPHLHEPASGVLAGLGYNGRGVAMATALGKVLADWAQGLPAASLPLPPTPIRPIPLHGVRRPILSLVAAWKRLLDAIECRAAR